jgi:hypothetical protein
MQSTDPPPSSSAPSAPKAAPMAAGLGLRPEDLLDELDGPDPASFLQTLPPFVLLVQADNLVDIPGDTLPIDQLHRTDMVGGFRIFSIQPRPESNFSFVSVGRNPHNDIVIPDASVSSFHAFFPNVESPEVLDARSTNGTYVDGTAVTVRGEGPPSMVPVGGTLRFGNVSAVLLDETKLLDFLRQLRGAANQL